MTLTQTRPREALHVADAAEMGAEPFRGVFFAVLFSVPIWLLLLVVVVLL